MYGWRARRGATRPCDKLARRARRDDGGCAVEWARPQQHNDDGVMESCLRRQREHLRVQVMIDYSRYKTLLESHRYSEAAEEARVLQARHVDDIGPVECLAEALLASGNYAEALPLYMQLD